jgi:hypothetical protein
LSQNGEKCWKPVRSHLTSHRFKPRPGVSLAENIISPLVDFVWTRDREHVLNRPAMSPLAQKAVRASLVRRLAGPVARLAYFQWQAFLSTPFLNVASTSEEPGHKLQKIFFSRGVENPLLVLTDNYPELTRILVLQIRQWRRFFAKFSRDADMFIRRAGWSADAQIESLAPDISDPHRGSTSVIRVGFRNGENWYYKPRPPGQTVTWFELLSRINDAGFSHPFKIPRVIRAQKHHWMEAIRERRCADESQLKSFMFRMGAFLYLLDVLQGVDFHAGNLVCHGAQPVFVDCETLAHPETPMPRPNFAQEKGLLRTGILPFEGAPDSTAAALGPITLVRLLSRQRLLSVEKAGHTVAEGFLAMHEFFAEEKPGRLSILRDTARRLRHSQCRAIYRPTSRYYSLLDRSLAPEMLSHTARRLAFLRKESATSYLPKRITNEEAAALQNLDIPFFLRRGTAHRTIPSFRKMRHCSRQIKKSLAQISRFSAGLFISASFDDVVARNSCMRARPIGLRGSPVK